MKSFLLAVVSVCLASCATEPAAPVRVMPPGGAGSAGVLIAV